MTRAHRRWHFWAWVVLTPAVLALFIAALVIRPEAAP
jgi:hypothetical protein